MKEIYVSVENNSWTVVLLVGKDNSEVAKENLLFRGTLEECESYKAGFLVGNNDWKEGTKDGGLIRKIRFDEI